MFTLCVPAFASSGSAYNQKTDFWSWFKDVPIISDFIGYTWGGVCPESNDSYHHANSYQVDKGDGTYKCICTYCGHEFTAYESDLQQSYNDYVGTLPVSGYNSSGNLIWYPTSSYLGAAVQVQTTGATSNWYSLHEMEGKSSQHIDGAYIISVSFASSRYYVGAQCFFDVKSFPVSGSYRLLETCALVGSIVGSVGVINTTAMFSPTSYAHYDTTSTIRVYSNKAPFADKSITYVSFKAFYPVFEVIPDTALSGDQYNITTRPTGITGGNYGIVGDNGQITKIEDNRTIINETNNTYYNPATGKTETVISWTYDYSTRSYNITLESGDTITVTYGDQNITINEGDTIYNIYYIIEGSGSDPDPSPSPDDNCAHEWYQTGAVQGNCVTPAQRTYTCSKCNKQYTETDPAPGHSWRIIHEVSTKYDDNGNLIQEGYTIYECERCGEQYKSTNDTGPPASGGGSSGGGSGSGSSSGIFAGIFGIIWDFFRFFFDFFSDFVVGGIKGFISAILDVGSDFFAILNPFDWGY